VVVDKLEAVLVESSSSVSLGNGQTNSVGDTLTEGTSGNLDSGSVVSLGVTRSTAVNGSESLQVIHAEVVTEQMEESILKHAAVSVRENETVTVQPVRVLGVEVKELVEQNVSNWGHSHGSTRVSRVAVSCRIGRKDTDGVDSLLIDLAVTHFD
jgi:hypothetical protein